MQGASQQAAVFRCPSENRPTGRPEVSLPHLAARRKSSTRSFTARHLVSSPAGSTGGRGLLGDMLEGQPSGIVEGCWRGKKSSQIESREQRAEDKESWHGTQTLTTTADPIKSDEPKLVGKVRERKSRLLTSCWTETETG